MLLSCEVIATGQAAILVTTISGNGLSDPSSCEDFTLLLCV